MRASVSSTSEVDVDRLPVPGEPDRHPGRAHLVEVQGRVALRSHRAGHRRAGQRRHVHLRLDPGHRHLGDLAHFGWQRSLFDQEHVGGEPGPLVHRLDVGHHARDLDVATARQCALCHHHVVKLRVLTRCQADRVLQRRGGPTSLPLARAGRPRRFSFSCANRLEHRPGRKCGHTPVSERVPTDIRAIPQGWVLRPGLARSPVSRASLPRSAVGCSTSLS